MKRKKFAQRLAIVVAVLIAVSLAFMGLFWEQVSALAGHYEKQLKPIGLLVGPLLGVFGFLLGIMDKAELKDAAKALGGSEQRVKEEKRLADEARKEVQQKTARIESLESDLSSIVNAGRLWKLRGNDPFTEYRAWKYDPQGAKIVTVSLFKGGVGKSHLAANFAAYVSERQQKPVLLIDLDYQGSVSVAIMQAAGLETTESKVDALFDDDADLGTLSSSRVHLAKNGEEPALNKGQGLSRAWIVPASYTLAEVEGRLLVDRVFGKHGKIDERYRLAHLLLHPNVRREYGLIIIDTPPRMTLGTVNALVASHAYIVPTILDRVSSEALNPFLVQLRELMKDLELDLRCAGVVASMTRQKGLTGNEPRYLDQVRATTVAHLGQGDWVLQQNLPRKSQVTNENDLGYFLRDSDGALAPQVYDPLFDELWKRIFQPENHGNQSE